MRRALLYLGLLFVAGALRAHEPYLLLTANPDGTFTAETGFSDGASPEGLKLLVRDRSTSETLAEHALPANGRLTLQIPPVPYRVVFEGGPGHRLSKPGPEPQAALSPAATAAAATSVAPPAAGTSAAAQAPVVTQVTVDREETTRIALVVGIFFLFGVVAFALGYGAGRRAR